MAGAALRGLGKALLKKTRSKYIKKIPRGTPTKAAFIARRNQLRGASITDKFKKPIPEGVKAPKKRPLIGKTEKGIGIGVLGTLAYQKLKEGKRVESKATKDKLQKAIDKKKAEDEKKKKAYGKRAPKKDKNYGGR